MTVAAQREHGATQSALAELEALLAAGLIQHIDFAFAGLVVELSAPCAAAREVALAAALASAQVRAGHACLALSACAGADAAAALGESAAQPVGVRLPALERWRAALLESPAVASSGAAGQRPLFLDAENQLYLDRLRDDEVRVAEGLRALAAPVEHPEDDARALGANVQAVVERLFGDDVAEYRQAAQAAAKHRLCVVTGGPGTGKTTLAARLIALLVGAALAKPERVALAAPTGKAAKRLQEAVGAQAKGLAQAVPALADYRADASTIHSLLFRARRAPLQLDALILDEASMVDVTLMAQLLGALPEAARLIVLGDASQLASVQPGAVLGDLCAAGRAAGSPLEPTLVELTQSHRFDPRGGIGRLAAAIVQGDADGALGALRDTAAAETRLEPLGGARAFDELATRYAREFCAPRVRDVRELGAAAQPFPELRVLCAHRSGPFGVERFNGLVERHLRRSGAAGRGEEFYAGRPIIVTRNDAASGLANGDVGVVLRAGGKGRVWFPELGSAGSPFEIAPARLPEHETFFALTVHRAQGSEYDAVAFVPGPVDSRIATRELFYTAVTRARSRVIVHGSAEAVRQAVTRQAARATGLAQKLAQ